MANDIKKAGRAETFALKIDQLNNAINVYVHDQRDQHVSRGIVDNGIWEAFETQLLIERLQTGITFIDVGANLGYYTVIAADRIGRDGKIIAFEPDPANFHLLQKNIAHNGFDFVDAVNAGLSDSNTCGQLFLSDSNYGDHQIYDNGEGRDSHRITLVNGTDYLRDRISRIDLLKVDTQGAESRVIAGLLPLLQQSADNLTIIIEFWPYGLRKAGSSAHQLLDMLLTLALPMNIIDHVGHQLIACSDRQLREWVDMVDAHPDDQGFMNIMLGR